MELLHDWINEYIYTSTKTSSTTKTQSMLQEHIRHNHARIKNIAKVDENHATMRFYKENYLDGFDYA